MGANAFWLLAGRAASQLLTILVTILIAHRMGDAVLGQYALITSVIFLFNGISTLGTDVLLVREIAARRDFSYFLPALTVQLAISALAILLIFVLTPYWPQQAGIVTPMRIYSLSLIPLAFFTVFGAALRGREQMGAYSFLTVMFVLMQVTGILLLPGTRTGIGGLIIVLLAAQIVVAIVAAIISFARLPDLAGVWRAKKEPIGRVLRAGAAIAAFGILATGYQRLSLYFVGSMQDAASTGWFAAALRVVEAPKFVHVAVLSALLPTMSQAHASKRRAQYARAFGLSFGGLVAFSAVFAVVVFLFAGPLTLFLFGEDFIPSVEVLEVVGWTLIPFTISQYFATRLLAASREKQIIASLLIAIAVLGMLCLLWIPSLGILGAAWAVVAAEVSLSVILLYFWARGKPSARMS
ncbi:MAG: oligosaccharide flippase family protein [Anaerolineales bacterium]